MRWKDWHNLLEGLGDAAGKVLWKIHNQKYGILKENLNSSVGFYLDFFQLCFLLDSPSLAYYWIIKRGKISPCLVFQIFSSEYKQDCLKK